MSKKNISTFSRGGRFYIHLVLKRWTSTLKMLTRFLRRLTQTDSVLSEVA